MPPDPLTYQRAAALRRKLTPPEARLWARLKGGRLHGIGFRRQHPIGIYILDFYCASPRPHSRSTARATIIRIRWPRIVAERNG